MLVVNGKKYYSVKEAASLSGVAPRTLQRWISGGQLSDFLFPFRTPKGQVLYRLEPPEPSDQQDVRGDYVLPEEGGGEA